MSDNHQQVSNSRPTSPQSSAIVEQHLHQDPFTELVRQVHDDPANPYNIERYLWVLEEPLRTCGACGAWFDPCFSYDGAPAQGLARRYCSLRCRSRAAYERQRARLGRRCGAPAWQLRSCLVCGALFDPGVSYAETPTRWGRRRSFCSLGCQREWTTDRVEGGQAWWGRAA